MRHFTHIFVLLTLLITGFTANGRELFPEIPEQKRTLRIQIQSEWYNSTANYKEFGKFSLLPHQNSFQYVTADPRIKYSPWSWFSIELFGGFMYGMSKTYNSFKNNYTIRNRPWFTSAGLGLSFHKKFQRLYFTADIKGSAPLNRFEHLTNDVVTGDGAYHIEPGLWFIYALSPHFAYLFYNTSFKYRTNKLSALSYHKLGGFIQTRYIDSGFSANVFFPLIADGYTDRPETRWNILKNVNGESYKFYSVNPAALSFTLWMEFKPVKFLGLQVYANLDTYGQFYGKGHTVGLMASGKWTFKSSKSRFEEELKQSKRLEEEDLNEGLEESEESHSEQPAIDSEITDEIKRLN